MSSVLLKRKRPALPSSSSRVPWRRREDWRKSARMLFLIASISRSNYGFCGNPLLTLWKSPLMAQAERTSILVVDDEEVIRHLCARILDMKGCPVTVAENADDALKKL